MAAALVASVGASAVAQTLAVETEPSGAQTSIEALAWIKGCWRGSVNQREFREHWLPLRGGMLIGAGQTVVAGQTQDFEYLRIESRPDGVYYVAAPSGRNEAAFRLTETTGDDRSAEFTFTRAGNDFPERIVYRRGAEGWLYASAEGRVGGEARKVIYPMRRIGCESGEVLGK
jgi:hypothetical protein